MRISSKARKRIAFIGGVLALGVAAVVAGGVWYVGALKPVDVSDDNEVRVEVKEGMVPSSIGQLLEDKGLIHSRLAFSIYLRLNGGAEYFKSGVYVAKRSQDMPSILEHLKSGQVDERSIMFYPGAMLRDRSGKPESQRTDVFAVLLDAGFDESEVTRALGADYQSPVFAGRPAGVGIEGYVYGETYFVAAQATPEQMIQRAIDEFAAVVKKSDFEAKFARQGLSLYEGITLASIVQRESIGCAGASVCEDQRRIASVFFNRLESNMPLGSDVTYHYAADLEGKARDFRLDSPYNTRIHAGLPPGPIAAPGLSALNAVADPAKTDYVYFLSGDDDVTYFATTNAGHEANIRNHCHKKCLLP